MQYFREIYFETKYLIQELMILIEHPTRKASREDVVYHLHKLWRASIGHPWYCLKRGITNLIKWFPIIWRTDIFDHCYLTEIMDKQLSEMEKFFASDHPAAVDHKHIAKRIAWTRKLYKMWCDEHYTMKYWDSHGFPESLGLKFEVAQVDSYGIPLTYKSSFDQKKGLDKEAMTKAYEKDQKVYKLYIKNLAKMRDWWD